MNAVGIDVSKGKSMVAILRPYGEIVASPFEVKHTASNLNSLIELIKSIDGESRIVMDELCNQIKTMNRQFGFYMKHKTAMKNKLIGILDQTYPGVNTYFDSPARSDGSQKWVDFASTYWHIDCVRKMSLNAFIDHYQIGRAHV